MSDHAAVLLGHDCMDVELNDARMDGTWYRTGIPMTAPKVYA
ncbi:MAG: hypothetical protein ACLSAC_27875 [Enterocloster bolteae]